MPKDKGSLATTKIVARRDEVLTFSLLLRTHLYVLEEKAKHLLRGIQPYRVGERSSRIAARSRMPGSVDLPLLEHASPTCIALD